MRWGTCWTILTCFLITGCLEYDPGDFEAPPDCDCEIDTDCPPMHICDDCVCTEVCYCESDADCGPGMFCMDCLCLPACDCMTDADCPEGYYCSSLCTCEPVCECESDSDCPSGDWCVECVCSGCEDLDGDGFTAGHGYADCDVDCDDNDPHVHPGMGEICNDLTDNDCDGQVDEDCGCDCLTDDDCPVDTRCWDCDCIPRRSCATNSECPEGWLCYSNGVICGPDAACGDGFCIPG
jgi:hypothetical protein